MTVPMETILVIDDDRDLCDLLVEYLKPEGFEVETAYDGEKGIEKALTGKYSIVVLDVMLPGRHDGYDVLKQIRARAAMPVLMLTARGDEVDRIIGLEMGADDYLSKPFNPRELLARIRAILRRSSRETQEGSTGMLVRPLQGGRCGDGHGHAHGEPCRRAGRSHRRRVWPSGSAAAQGGAHRDAGGPDPRGARPRAHTVRSQHRCACKQASKKTGPGPPRGRADPVHPRQRLYLCPSAGAGSLNP